MPAHSVETLGQSLVPIVDRLQEILHGVRSTLLLPGAPGAAGVMHGSAATSFTFTFVQARLPKDCQVDLPEVAVVGSQSSGKSSVLESLVRRQNTQIL